MSSRMAMSSSSCSTSDFCCCSRAEFPLSGISRWWRGAGFFLRSNGLRSARARGREGTLAGKQVVVCCAGMGKANAAATTQVLITKFGAEKIIFSGIAGNMTSKIGIGDVVIGKTVLYHDAQLDMICQNPPFLKEYTGDPALIAAAEKACADAGVKALAGKIATGDLFVGDSATKAAIEAKCAPDCVEMEGAAVSQIAAKNDVPCVILRAMSDNADEDGHEVLVVKKFSITEYVATATKIVAAMVESL